MGRDLTLYPHQATRNDLKNYLENLGFTKCKHLWEWPKGTLNYFWFDHDDFKSIDGVSADIYPATDAEPNLTANKWALHVRNLYSASWHDVNMLNEVLRGARNLFGGTIKGDYGTNRYAPLWKDNSTPISRGISAIYQHVTREISAVRHSLPEPLMEPPKLTGTKFDELLKYTQSMDPSRVLYNGLVPFAVSMFEYFFSQAFQVLIKYDESALNKRRYHKQKITFESLLEVDQKEATVESIIAQNYTFQNLNQLNKAYKDWLDIDVRELLYKKKRIGNSVSFLEKRISDIIQYRHGIVHHFSIDRSLTRQGYIHILEAVEKSLEELTSFIEKKYNIEVDRDY